jgi:hypothetical protein
VILKAKDSGRPVNTSVCANAFKYRAAIVQRVGEYMNLRLIPRNNFSVKPDELRRLHSFPHKMCFRCVARTGKRIYFAKLLKNGARGNHNVAAKRKAFRETRRGRIPVWDKACIPGFAILICGEEANVADKLLQLIFIALYLEWRLRAFQI